jgi:AcrR family transcriptional regulator
MARASLDGPALFHHPLAAAVIEVVVKRGYREAAIAEMLARAGTSPEEFERVFTDKEDAVLRVFAASIEDFKARIGAAFGSLPEWPENLRAAAYEAARWMLAHQAATRLVLVEVFEAGERALAMRDDLVAWCAELIDVGREVAPDPEAVPSGASLVAMGATAEILTRHVQANAEIVPIVILPQMMYGAVRPYLGEEAARRELLIPLPEDLRP